MGKMLFLQGNEAVGLAAIKAGCRFFAGYPITPSTEIAEYMARELPKVGGTFIQMEDELSSASAIIGASLAGTKSMTATSGPGFSLMQEAIGYAIMAEVPTVFVDVMRGGPSTGSPTDPSQGDIMQIRWGTHGDHQIIALYPSTVEEVYIYTIEAFNYAEMYRTPVILALDETLAHMRENVYFDYDKENPRIIERLKERELDEDELFLPYDMNYQKLVNPLVEMGKTRFHVSGLFHDESGFPTSDPNRIAKVLEHLDAKIRLYAEEISIYNEYLIQDAQIVVIAFGSVARSALRAVKQARSDKIPVGLFKPITLWPLPTSRLKMLLKNSQIIIVPEMNKGQYVREISRLNKANRHIESLTKTTGKLITSEEILDVIVKMWIQISEM
ncbi:MAG: 2-oxoacid:acceptor oxidoreductase subunit alpha [Defluviitoga tunisiensis]|jgi:2-oxoglutarate ferredoxin oxidoreductase subunit alpha|nr:2-oxoacid:acceptor oxidoreductase subunit alpha [Defluviitoga tunisiensis]MDY0379540.1 2-oxoacid:acceptor oxidoreductase subunit alpha [Defluviitoga tunisiensis]HOB55081.1 2-oxoacid:acceptor oxidoreductase subunit alpha [Defluviitoga tunisiensis]HOP33938.1 2-oxoacid:acceptor oxidoreductase subunit alpha [Defluviitoga tunisiensis]